MNKLVLRASAAAAVLLVAAVGSILLPGLAIPGPGANASPSPVLLATGRFIEHDWGLVEMEATREGSAVAGRMTVGEDRGAGFPISVDFRCARTTEDGEVLIGGYVSHLPPATPTYFREGTNALMQLKVGLPHNGLVFVGDDGVPAGDCIGYLDHWLTHRQLTPPGFLDDGSVEFGPGAKPAP